MAYSREKEIEWNNEVITCETAWRLKRKGFNWPCLNGYSARRYLKPISDGTWFYHNPQMYSAAAAPTKGMLNWWLQKEHNLYIDFRLREEDFRGALDKLPDVPY